MKLIINAIDKMIISQLMPRTESILVQTMARDITRKIELTEKDRKTINLKPSMQGQGVTWDMKDVDKTNKEIEFSEAEIGMLKEQIDRVDREKKVTTSMLNTALKIRDVKLKEAKK